MSGKTPHIEWYIARDGTQHGPISDVEMHKFVELGHLRAVDLVWCAHFTEWITGAQAFPATFNPQPAHPPADGAPIATPAASIAAPPQPRHPEPVQAAARSDMPAPSPAVVPQPGNPPVKTAWPPANEPARGPAGREQRQADPAASDPDWAAAMRAVIQADKPVRAPAFEMAPQHGPGPVGPPNAAPSPVSHGFDAAPQPYPQGQAAQTQSTFSNQHQHPGTTLERRDHSTEEYTDEPPARRSWGSRFAAAIAVLLIVGGLGWIGWQNRGLISGASAIGGIITAKISNTSSADMFRATPYEAAGETRDLIDVSLQKSAVWRTLKRDFADWYAERLVDIERMRAQKNDEKTISKFLADVIVTLRRRNAQAALQSSHEHLKRMAGAFLGNLKQLASRDGQTCFGFITFGEANPFMQELSRTPAFAESLQRQLVAVFESIADGRANRAVHPATRRADYDILTQELMARGWTQQDLGTFSDPQRLSKSPPEKVCTLVQEWFTAQLGLKDAELQARLLAESLKPLVGG